MAGGTDSVATGLGEISLDQLECSICHKRYDTPKILPCLHSFCEKCLVAYQISSQEPSVIKCPVCLLGTQLRSNGVLDLKTNFRLMEIVSDVTLRGKLTQEEGAKVLCELCEDQREATSRCMECPIFLCAKCLSAHRRIAASHEVMALDALRSFTASPEISAEPSCEKHRDEKKKFFCESCDELICKQCTVVEHQEHKFSAIDDVASRLRETTKGLIKKLEKSFTAHQNIITGHNKMDNLDKSVSLAKQKVTMQTTLEGSKITQLESSILQGISEREGLRLGYFHAHEYIPEKRKESEARTATSTQDKRRYSESSARAFTDIDSKLDLLVSEISTLRSTDNQIIGMMSTLKEDSQKGAACNQSKVAARKDELLSQIDKVFEQRTNFDKTMEVHLLHVRHTLEIAGNLVKSASDVDFLNLHSMIDDDLRSLLEQSSLTHYGYPKIEFKSSSDIALGDLIGVPGATWEFTREIVPEYSEETTKPAPERLQREQYRPQYSYARRTSYINVETIHKPTDISMDSFRNDEILVVCRHSGVVLVYNTAGTRTIERKTSAPEGGGTTMTPCAASALPDGSFIIVNTDGRADLYASDPTNFSPVRFHASDPKVDGSFASVVHYMDKKIILGYNNWQDQPKCKVYDCAARSEIRQIPVRIQPDFLACTSGGWILVGAKSPACVEGLDSSENTVFIIHPTIEGCPVGDQLTCQGLCTDRRDYIYVAVASSSPYCASMAHIHQYSPYGSFIGCLTDDIQPPISGITMTGDDVLVVAELHMLKLFQMER